jgi:Rrf2 family protein
MFSKACEYGIRASIFIAEQSLLGKKVSLKDVAKATNSPEAYTSKILQKLTRHKIVNSDKGPNGGFSIQQQEIDSIKLSDIVFAIDGDKVYCGCGLGLPKCDEAQPCPVHYKFKVIRGELKDMLETTTIQSLTLGLVQGLTFLKR